MLTSPEAYLTLLLLCCAQSLGSGIDFATLWRVPHTLAELPRTSTGPMPVEVAAVHTVDAVAGGEGEGGHGSALNHHHSRGYVGPLGLERTGRQVLPFVLGERFALARTGSTYGNQW